MLTLTYALVALSVEHKRVKGSLLQLQQGIQQEKSRASIEDSRRFDSLITQFERLDEGCRVRNFELYVLPAIHLATEECDREGRRLLADIEALTMMGRIILKTVRKNLRLAFAEGQFDVEDICNSLELYCQNLLKRLTIEELHLLPLAQRVISSDEWFDIAAQFISHELERHPTSTVDSEDEAILVPSRSFIVGQHRNVYQAAT